jgi:molybdate transport system substrate-binding protein
LGLAQAETKTITVSAAISLKNAFEDIGKLYMSQHKDAKVSFNFGASGDLAKQITGGAPVDVFASAAQKDMDQIEKSGFVLAGTRTNFAGNSLVLIVPVAAKISVNSFEYLTSSQVKKIAIGNPKSVPAGRYAEETLQYYEIYEGVKGKLVFSENARQVLDYVARDEVDAGIVYLTDAMIMTKKVKVMVNVPEASHKPVIYPLAVVKESQSSDLAKEFIATVTSEQGQAILGKYGFRPVAGSR